MYYIKEKAISWPNSTVIYRFLFLAGLSSLIPFYLHVQWFTGPLVNALLIICLFIIGIRSALLLCLLPSLMALSGGLLPPVLAPVVPFIMLSNVFYILSIDWFYANIKSSIQGFWWGVFIGSSIKYAFLFLSINLISRLIIKNSVVQKVAQMMSWPQFATAVLGGVIAWIFLKWIKRI